MLQPSVVPLGCQLNGERQAEGAGRPASVCWLSAVPAASCRSGMQLQTRVWASAKQSCMLQPDLPGAPINTALERQSASGQRFDPKVEARDSPGMMKVVELGPKLAKKKVRLCEGQGGTRGDRLASRRACAGTSGFVCQLFAEQVGDVGNASLARCTCRWEALIKLQAHSRVQQHEHPGGAVALVQLVECGGDDGKQDGLRPARHTHAHQAGTQGDDDN